MISDSDRSYYFGASDTDKIIGNTKTKTFEKWWLEKMGLYHNTFTNDAMMAGTYFEHPILDSLGFPIEKDKQIIVEPLRLRVNLDGNTDDTIYEIKTYKLENGFKLPLKYQRQVWVQMFGTGFRKAKLVAYGLEPEDYKNYLRPIDPERLSFYDISYNEKWINETYLPRLKYLAKCLDDGEWPD